MASTAVGTNGQFAQHKRRSIAGLLTMLLLILSMGQVHADAADPAVVLSRPPELYGLSEAAAALDARFWNDPKHASDAVRVTVRIAARQTALVVNFPRRIPSAALVNWLRQSAESLHWPDADLAYHLGTNRSYAGLLVDTDNLLRNRGLTRRLELELPRLTAQAKLLHPAPPLFAIRSGIPGLELDPEGISRSAVQGTYRGRSYFLLDSANAPRAPVVLTYRLPTRWLTAALVALTLWGLFALPAALALRRDLERKLREQPAELARKYRTQSSLICLVAVLGCTVTLWSLGMERLDFFAAGLGVLWPLLFVPPVWSLAYLECHLARPRLPDTLLLGRWQDIAWMVLFHSGIMALAPGGALLFLFGRNRGSWAVFSTLTGCVLIAFGLFILLTAGLRSLRAARLPNYTDLPHLDGSVESIRRALGEARRLFDDQPHYQSPIPPHLQGSPEEQLLQRIQEGAQALCSEQRAALRVAVAEGMRSRHQADRSGHAVSLLACSAPIGSGTLLIAGQPSLPVSGVVLLATIVVVWLSLQFLRRVFVERVYAVQFAADLRVARELEQPDCLTAALTCLEAFVQQDPVLSDPRVCLDEFTRRRDHLERALAVGPPFPPPQTGDTID